MNYTCGHKPWMGVCCVECRPDVFPAHVALTAQPAGAKVLRDESTPEGKKIWADVDKAASRAPDWTKAQFGPHPTICGGCGGDGTRQNPYQRACKYASQHPNDPRYVWDEPAPLTVAGAIGRDEFEAWAKSEYMAVHRNGGKQYVNTPTQHAWLGWQAATRNLRVVKMPIREELADAIERAWTPLWSVKCRNGAIVAANAILALMEVEP